MTYGIIYKVTNLVNGKTYIGQTVRELRERRNEHLSKARRGSDFSLHRALRKYGEENFKWEIIDESDTQEDLNNKETYWINFLNTFTGNKGSHGYNMTTGGESSRHTEETKRKLSEINSGRIGHKHTKETKEKLSNLREKEKNPFYGKKHTDETREKISDKAKGGNNSRARAVIKLDVKNNFIEEYSTVTEGALSVNGGRKSVKDCCLDRKESYKGFKWMYKEDYLALEK